MTYVTGKTAVKEVCLDVYIRNHANAATEPWTSATGIGDITSTTDLHQNSGSDQCDWAGVAASAINTTNTTEFGKIGAIGESPYINIADGDEVALACEPHQISENIESIFEDLQATKDHWEMIRAIAAVGNIDILLAPKGAHLSSEDQDGYAFADVPLRVTGEFPGKGQRKIICTCKKEVEPLSETNFKIINVSNVVA